MNARHVMFSAFLLPVPQAQSLSEPCFTPQNKSFGQMVAGTSGERCQKRFCVPGQWGTHTAPRRDWGWHTSPPLGTKSTPLGIIPVLERSCSAWTTWLCLWDQLLKAKISPKCILKPKPPWNCFLCFLPVWHTWHLLWTLSPVFQSKLWMGNF